MSSSNIYPFPSQPPAKAVKNVAHLREGYRSTDQRRTELLLGPTGRFRPVIEEYLSTVAIHNYQPETLTKVRTSLGKFFTFVVQNGCTEHFDEIRPSTVTHFIEAERQRGIRNRIVVGHLSNFFDWLICKRRCDRGNPVVPRLHRQLLGRSLTTNESSKERNTDLDVR